MIDLVQYIVSELKSKRLSKSDALGLVKQWSARAPLRPGAAAPHPLLHRNTSDLSQHGFATRFSGEEFFLRDHRIQGRQVLPGVAYLEMARAAVSLAWPDRPETARLEIRNVAWASPIVFPDHRDVALALSLVDDGAGGDEQVEFEVCSADDKVHFQGSAAFREAPVVIRHDLAALTARMSKGRLVAADLYAAMARSGIELGPSLQGVKTVHRGEQELLVEIELPAGLEDTREQYVLHPSVMDSALQAGMALVMEGTAQTGQPPIPFALESLRVLGDCTPRMFAWVRVAAGSGADDRILKLDLDLCDADGQVRVQMQGFSSRVLGGAQTGCLHAVPSWAVEPLAHPAAPAAVAGERHVLLCDLPGIDVPSLSARLVAPTPCIELQASQGRTPADRYTDIALQCFETLKAILLSKPTGRALVQIVVPNDAEHLVLRGLSGLLGTAAQENPKLVGQLLFVDAHITTDALAILLQQEAHEWPDAVVRYENGQRQALRWRTVDAAQAGEEARAGGLKEDGVYLITGGLGGLGVLFAREILARARHASIVLTGRSELERPGRHRGRTERGHRAARGLSACRPGRCGRRGADGRRHPARLRPTRRHPACGRHGADNFILKKSTDEIRQVFGPKVTGTFHLDQATRSLELDFFVLFSSGVSVYRQCGPGRLRGRERFHGRFRRLAQRPGRVEARHGRHACRSTGRCGKTAAWAWMRRAGMLAQTTGMQPMQTATACRRFIAACALRQDQLLVMEGDLERMRSARSLGQRPVQAGAEPAPAAEPQSTPASLASRRRTTCAGSSRDVLKLPPRQDRSAGRAGELRHRFHSGDGADRRSWRRRSARCPRRCFFEYQTIASWRNTSSRIAPRSWLRCSPQPSAAGAVAAPAGAGRHAARRGPNRVQRAGCRAEASRRARAAAADPIAIIGLSGRYPEARRSRGVLAQPARRQGLHHRGPEGALGLARLLQRGPHRARAATTASGAGSSRASTSSIRCSSTSRPAKRS